jgi:hypothetical protein
VADAGASASLATLALLAHAATTLDLAALNLTTLDLATAHSASHCPRHHSATFLAAHVSAMASFLAALLVTLASFAGSSSFN